MRGLRFVGSRVRLEYPVLPADLTGAEVLLLGTAEVLDCTPHGRAKVVGVAAEVDIWVAGVDMGFRIGSRIAFFNDVRASMAAAVTEAALAEDWVGFA